jgi:hypothetical protein
LSESGDCERYLAARSVNVRNTYVRG